MHTSTLLKPSDFTYQRNEMEVSFQDFFPGFHPLDRVGIVVPQNENGALYLGYALLALTTTFYEGIRGQGREEFFDYPQHYAFLASSSEGVATRAGRFPLARARVGAAWSNLDVWPPSHWIAAPETVTGMVDMLARFDINRVFWPEGWHPIGEQTSPLPYYNRKILANRLKAVYFYAPARPEWKISASQPVRKLVEDSLNELPIPAGGEAWRLDHPEWEGYRQVDAETFLSGLDDCFEPDKDEEEPEKAVKPT